jgi:hypothetical protein
MNKLCSLCAALLLTPATFAEPEVFQSSFDPLLPNAYQVQFPAALGGMTLNMPISGGDMSIEVDATANTSKLLTWNQEVEPIEIAGMSTGPITITMDTNSSSEGSYDATTRSFSVGATFLINFDDSELAQIGFVSPMALFGREEGTIYGVGQIGTINMQLEGGGTVAGSDFSYTCRTTGRIDYDLDDSQGQSGDVNHDRLVDLSDSVSVLQSLFLDGSMACPVAANVNGDTATDLSDVVFLLSFIFQGGPAPPSQPVTCSDT